MSEDFDRLKADKERIERQQKPSVTFDEAIDVIRRIYANQQHRLEQLEQSVKDNWRAGKEVE